VWQLLSIEEAKAALTEFNGEIAGTGIGVLRGVTPATEKDHFPISIVAELAAEKQASDAKPKPLYLRGPDARPQSGFALERQA
jgi:tRNA threonylcarbamoyladenosine biosynthesis protein TsaB